MTPTVGLCSVCAHARTVTSGKGSTFWMCTLAATDPRFRKYPALPVLQCSGFTPREDPHDEGQSPPR